MEKSASISPCERYRYSLRRIWDREKPRLGVLMLNPSTADASADDPTIRKVIGFAERLGYGSIEVVNLFAFRATDPKELWANYAKNGAEDTVGRANDTSIGLLKWECSAILLAYGAGDPKGRVMCRVRWLERWVFPSLKLPMFNLGSTKERFPRHPLYVPYSAVDQVPDACRFDRAPHGAAFGEGDG